MIDRFNETLQDLLAKHGGNYTALANSLDNVVTRSYLSMLMRGERKKGKASSPPFQLVEKIKEKYGIDPTTGKQIVTDVPRGITVSSDIDRVVGAFEKAMDNFQNAFNALSSSNNNHIASLQQDKRLLEEDRSWLKQHIDSLTVSLKTLKQA